MSNIQQRQAWSSEADLGQSSVDHVCRCANVVMKIWTMIPSGIHRLFEQPYRLIGWLLGGKAPDIIDKIV